jgi:hypothetical protein
MRFLCPKCAPNKNGDLRRIYVDDRDPSLERIATPPKDASVLLRISQICCKFAAREGVNLDIANRLPRTKHESWSYEQEVRMFLDLNDPPDAKGLNWVEFGPLLLLKEVTIGAQCDPTVSKKVEVKPYGDAIECWWACRIWPKSSNSSAPPPPAKSSTTCSTCLNKIRNLDAPWSSRKIIN